MSTATLEEYLEAIYKISENGVTRPTKIAAAMGVSGPTVTATLKRLESRGLITRSGGKVSLSAQGQALALDIIRRHRISERFLVDILGMSWDEAHEDACRLEHALSSRVLERLEKFLDNPDSCPHGHPIPTAEGHVSLIEATPLGDHEPGASLLISRVTEEDEAMLAYLGSMNMYPGSQVLIREVAPFFGPITIEVDGITHVIGREVANSVFVVKY